MLKKITKIAFINFIAILVMLLSASHELKKIKSQEPVANITTQTSVNQIAASPTIATQPKSNVPKTATSKAVPTSVPQEQAAQPTSAPQQQPQQTGCIVKVFDSLYNVEALRRTHSGGDVFTCGTDMTAIFQSQHGNNVALISPYKI